MLVQFRSVCTPKKFPIAPTLFILAMSNWYKMVHGNGISISTSRK